MRLSNSRAAPLAVLLWLFVAAVPLAAVDAFRPVSVRSSNYAAPSTRPIQDVRRMSNLKKNLPPPVVTGLLAAKSGINGDTTTQTIKEDATIAPYKALLLDALGFNTTAANVLLQHIQEKDDKEKAFFLDSLLENGPDARLPFWSHFKRMAKTSRRARWAALRRVLDQKAKHDNDTVKRRDSLVFILEQLAQLKDDDNQNRKPAILVILEENPEETGAEQPVPSYEESSFYAEAEQKLNEELKQARIAAEEKKKAAVAPTPLPGMDVGSMMNTATVDVLEPPPPEAPVVEEAANATKEAKATEEEMTTTTTATTTKDIEIVAVPRQTAPSKETTLLDKIDVVVPRGPLKSFTTRGSDSESETEEVTTKDFEIVAANRDSSSKQADSDDISSEEATQTRKLMKQVKESGTAGILSYALWEFAFWAISVPVCIVGYEQVTGHWPDLTNAEDQAKLGAEAFAFVNFARFAVPLRIGLAVSTTPWIQENIVDPFLVTSNNDAGDDDGDSKKKEE